MTFAALQPKIKVIRRHSSGPQLISAVVRAGSSPPAPCAQRRTRDAKCSLKYPRVSGSGAWLLRECLKAALACLLSRRLNSGSCCHRAGGGPGLCCARRVRCVPAPRRYGVRGEITGIRGGERQAGWNLARSLPEPPRGL